MGGTGLARRPAGARQRPRHQRRDLPVHCFKDRGCDEMTSIRLQAKLTYDLQAYVGRMYGGPGKGWFDRHRQRPGP
ncbi:hypothetical protein LT493_10330 [Streptomyces tricolor]|nr:hypothetical protein [Streptomyces tricolor]